MGKNNLIDLISGILIPLGFAKRKGANWLMDSKVISKVVNVQKSKFGNSFYINFGYIISSLPLDDLEMHVFLGFGSEDESENARIMNLLDFDSSITDEQRLKELKQLINSHLVSAISKINTEEDLLNYLLQQQHLNDIPLTVKRHFKL
jgi:hypothetical protein